LDRLPQVFSQPPPQTGNRGGKPGSLDVKVRAKSGPVIDIEIQVSPQREIGKRLSFYKSWEVWAYYAAWMKAEGFSLEMITRLSRLDSDALRTR
jgi:hypothetical protein